eukprot:c4904_g1_i1.p1 GENE.c4904_g1_i1~~c4904_g1_i1.p1  ORF type:complete len:131 (+),score=24.93 c4904_g1_i1:31-393(+)
MSDRRNLYVGGLADDVDEALVRAAFIPFGDLVSVNMPIDSATQKHRGFAFVEFEEAEDAKAAIENMNESELNGRVLKVNLSRPMGPNKYRPVWESEEYLQARANEVAPESESNKKPKTTE